MNSLMFLLDDPNQEDSCQMGHTLVPSRDVRKDFGVGGPFVSRNPDVFVPSGSPD